MKIRCLGCMEEYDEGLNQCPYCSFSLPTAYSEPYFLAPKTVLDGCYIIGKSLGHSSSAITYLGWDNVRNRKVVIKEYFPKNYVTRVLGQNEINIYDGKNSKLFEEGLRTFVDSHNKFANLFNSTESVAKIEAVFIENSTAYVVTEYVLGVTLKDVLLNNPKIPFADVVELIKPVLMALQEIHNKGIIHANLSPENILFTRDKKVKFVGFGSWKVQTDESAVSVNLVSKSGYTAPELFGDKVNLTTATDVYSVAAIMLHAVSGVKPVTSIERGNKPLVIPDFVPESLADALTKALSVNQLMRTADCKSFFNDLQSFTNGKKRAQKAKHNKIIFALVAFLIIALGGILAILFSDNSDIKNFNSSGSVFPDLYGANEKEVVALLEEVGLDKTDYKIVGRLNNVDGKPGSVVWQSIEPGQKVSKDIFVELKIADTEIVEADKNSTKATVPHLIALNENEARLALEKAGFSNCSVERKVNDLYKTGLVCEQSVAAKEVVEKNTVIIIYIAENSQKQEQRTNSQVTSATTQKTETTNNIQTNQTTQTAKTTIATTKSSAQSKPNGNKPTESTPDKNSEITERMVIVPDVVGYKVADACEKIEEAGLVTPEIKEVPKEGINPNNVTVVSMSHKPGEEVPANTVIICEVYTPLES